VAGVRVLKALDLRLVRWSIHGSTRGSAAFR